MAETVLDLDLSNIQGIGPRKREKLIDGGIESVLDLAASLPGDVKEVLGGNREGASRMLLSARIFLEKNGLLDKEFMTADEVLERRRRLMRCTTGSEGFDDLLKGGIETQAITELFGEFGTGKSQICHTLAAMCQLPLEEGGLGGTCLFIDTENTFRPERLKEIAEARELDSSEILKSVVLCRVYNSSHLELVVRSLGKYIEQYGARLVVVDSVISLHRAEFIGRGTLAERQQRLNDMIHRLLRVGEIYNVAVVVTNQVLARPDLFFGDPTKPTGGHVIAHACTYRIYLKKAARDRVAVIVDSPCHPYSDTKFRITEKGIEDV